jgi:hypothetical protein
MTQTTPTTPGRAHQLAIPWGPSWLRRCATALAAIYLLAIGLDAIGTGIPDQLLPLPVRFFVQDAALFPHASAEVVHWRVEGWWCKEQRFAEIDVRPFFPIRRDDKESRFYRAMFFHHRQRPVLEALDAFIAREQNRAHPDDRIGGVILLSLRIPIPPPGTPEPRYRWIPLADFPHSVERRYWYKTATDDRMRKCADTP